MENQSVQNYNFSPQESDNKIINMSYRPTPSDRELEWDRSKVLLSKTDSRGNILYANEAFIDVCGYDDFELMDKSHNILRHPDMPKVVFKLMWECLEKEENFHVVIKNMSKTGRFYWVANDIKLIKDSRSSNTYLGQQYSVSGDILTKHIEPLYKKLLQIEKASGVQSSENYLIGFLEEKGITFVEYMDNLVYSIDSDADMIEDKIEEAPKKGMFGKLFGK